MLEEAAAQRPARRPRGGARAARRRGAPRRATAGGDGVSAPRASSSPTNCCAGSPRRCGRRSSTRKGHPIIARNLEALSAAIQLLHSLSRPIVIGIVGDEVIVDDMPMAKADTLGPLIRRLQQSGVERITIDRGVTSDEICGVRRGGDGARRAAPASAARTLPGAAAHPRRPRHGRAAGRRQPADMATIKRLYSDAVSVAGDSLGQRRRPKASPTRRRRAR